MSSFRKITIKWIVINNTTEVIQRVLFLKIKAGIDSKDFGQAFYCTELKYQVKTPSLEQKAFSPDKKHLTCWSNLKTEALFVKTKTLAAKTKTLDIQPKVLFWDYKHTGKSFSEQKNKFPHAAHPFFLLPAQAAHLTGLSFILSTALSFKLR